MRVYCQFQRGFGFIVIALARIKHRKVVVRLWKFREVLGEAGKYLDGLCRLFLFGEDQPFQKTSLCILGLLGKSTIDFDEGLVGFALLIQARSLLGVFHRTRLGTSQKTTQQRKQSAGAAAKAASEGRGEHSVIIH